MKRYFGGIVGQNVFKLKLALNNLIIYHNTEISACKGRSITEKISDT